MSDTLSDYFPPTGIELNLAEQNDGTGVDWDANAQTSVTAEGDGASFKGLDYPPAEQSQSGAPDLSSIPPLVGSEFGDLDDAPPPSGEPQDIGGASHIMASLQRIGLIALAVGAVLTAAGLGLEYLGLDPSQVFSSSGEDPTFVDVPVAVAPPAKQRLKQEVREIDPVLGNRAGGWLPYVYVPNPFPQAEPMERVWSAQEDETWRNGISHRYPWQRYKTVMEVREARLMQSNIILWDALRDEKFWIRMRAVMGLAEFGVPVSATNIKKALGEANSSLVARFFKRFHRGTAGERFVLREALGLVDARGRKVILQTLAKARDEHLGLYLIAAQEDPSWQIKRWVHRYLARFPWTVRRAWQEEFARLKRQPLRIGREREVDALIQQKLGTPGQEAKFELERMEVYPNELPGEKTKDTESESEGEEEIEIYDMEIES